MKSLFLSAAVCSVAILSGAAFAQGRGGGPPVGAGPPVSAPVPAPNVGPPTTNPGFATRDTARANRQGPSQADDHATQNANENAGLAGDATTAEDPSAHGVETRDEARANRQGPDNANENALANADANAGLSADAPDHPLTTEELNRREAARIRALGPPMRG